MIDERKSRSDRLFSGQNHAFPITEQSLGYFQCFVKLVLRYLIVVTLTASKGATPSSLFRSTLWSTQIAKGGNEGRKPIQSENDVAFFYSINR